MAFGDWSTTNSANSTVGGIDIAENCPPSSLNNAIREVMAQLRAAFNPFLSTFFAAGDAATARTAIGAVAKAGDTVTGNLVRGSAGPHIYHTNAAYASGRLFFTAIGASNPTDTSGDIWITGS